MKNKRSICKDRMLNQEAYYKWFDVAKHHVAYCEHHVATRNIDQIRESRNSFAVHSFDHLIDS